MYYGIRARGGINGYGMYYSTYFIVLVLFGNCILVLTIRSRIIGERAELHIFLDFH